MKILILILLSLNCFGQDTASWTTTNEAQVKSYELQFSTDNVNFSAVSDLPTSYHSFTFLAQNGYYRVKGLPNWYSNTLNVTQIVTVPVFTIINAGLIASKSFVQVYWTSQNENLKTYEIDRAIDGVTFSLVSSFSPKGNSNYSVQINRPTTTTTTGWLWWKKTVTTIDSRKETFRICSYDFNGVKTILKTLSE
jgi:hypothetical protein